MEPRGAVGSPPEKGGGLGLLVEGAGAVSTFWGAEGPPRQAGALVHAVLPMRGALRSMGTPPYEAVRVLAVSST